MISEPLQSFTGSIITSGVTPSKPIIGDGKRSLWAFANVAKPTSILPSLPHKLCGNIGKLEGNSGKIDAQANPNEVEI